MSASVPKNIAASVRQRLLNKARDDARPFSELLQYYAMERFLYRLSISPHEDKFILKGAMMIRAWGAPMDRPTMDIDMLGRNMRSELEEVLRLVGDICLASAGDDGLEFSADSVRGEQITAEAEYEGVRVRLIALLGKAKIPMQIDIGFGDVVVPGPQEIILPTMLDFPPARLSGYSLDSVIAEKFEAMVKLGALNSRMKDFYDIWMLSRLFEFKGSRLQEAVCATFRARGTEMPSKIVALSSSFVKRKEGQWQAFQGRLQSDLLAGELSLVIEWLAGFFLPLVAAIREGERFSMAWKGAGVWQEDDDEGVEGNNFSGEQCQ